MERIFEQGDWPHSGGSGPLARMLVCLEALLRQTAPKALQVWRSQFSAYKVVHSSKLLFVVGDDGVTKCRALAAISRFVGPDWRASLLKPRRSNPYAASSRAEYEASTERTVETKGGWQFPAPGGGLDPRLPQEAGGTSVAAINHAPRAASGGALEDRRSSTRAICPPPPTARGSGARMIPFTQGTGSATTYIPSTGRPAAPASTRGIERVCDRNWGVAPTASY